jgi:pimeloyl-ACP methyl ester carboxylesterase
MHVVHDGLEEAPPMLLVHGSGATGSSWGPMVPALASRHHVIRVDLSGCGQSPPASTYTVPNQASRVAALLDDLGLREVTVVGHSSGGYVGTALAEQRPDLVGSLALVSTGPSMDALLPQPIILRVLMGPPLGAIIWPLRTDAMMRRGINATAARPIEVTDDVVADLRPTSYRTFRAIMRANGAYITERSVPERLAGLGLRVLAVFGDADPRWDPASVHQYEVVPGAQIEFLAGVGHVAMLEDPTAATKLLLKFAS